MYSTFRLIIYRILAMFHRIPFLRQKLIVLCYHSVNEDWHYSLPQQLIEKQISFLLSQGYRPYTLNDLAEYLAGNRTFAKPGFVVTFDDGYKSVLQMRNFFLKKNIKPTLFVLSDPLHANHQELDNRFELLKNDDLQLVLSDGWNIGSHSATHPDFANSLGNRIQKEVVQSRNTLADNLQIEINSFSYPKGRFSEESVEQVAKAGYELAFTINPGIITAQTDKLLIPRFSLDRSQPFYEFVANLTVVAVLLRVVEGYVSKGLYFVQEIVRFAKERRMRFL